MLLEIHSNQDNDNIKESSLLAKRTCSKSEQVLQGVIQTLNILTLITYLKYTKFPKMSANKQDEQNSFSSLVDQNKRRRLNEKDNYNFDNDDTNRIEQEKQHLPIEIANSEGALVSDYQKSDFFEGIMDSDQKPENGKVEEQNEELRTSNELSLGEAFEIKSKNEIDCNKDVNEVSKEKSKYTDNYNSGIREDCNSSTRNTIDESFSSKINESTNENSKECMENKNNIRNSPDQQPENLCETQGGGYYPQYTQAPNIGYSETIGVQSKETYSHTENDDNLLKNSNPSLNAINVSDGSDRTQHNINPSNRKEGSNHELEINSSYSNSEGNCFEQNLPKTNDMIPLWAPHEEFKYIHKPELNNFRHSSNQKAEDLQTNSSLPLYKPHHQPERQSPNVDMNALDINRYINQQAGFSQQEPAQLQSPNHFIHDPNVFNQIIHNPNDQLQTQNELINNPQRLQNRDLYLESHHQYTQEQYFKNPTNQHHNINVFNDMQSQLQIHGHLPPHNSEENKLEMNAPHISSYGTHSATEHIRIPQHSSQQDSMQIANNYHHLMIDEFHEDPNTTYKLTLSPAVKHENQDDGYETSAGDVLTPNSHTSSTHSVTPQQQGQLSTSSNPKQKQDEHQVPSHQDEHTHTQIQGTIRTGEMFFDQRHSQNFNPESSSPSEITNQLQPSSDIVETETNYQQQSLPEGIPPLPEPKRRGRKKKIVDPTLIPNSTLVGNPATGTKNKERKKHDRFNGMSEEEVSQRHLPDHLCDNLDIVIIGINPGLFAAYKGHHYAGPGNHFWKCLYLAGLTPEQMSSEEDYKLINSGIGFTNMVQRPTKGSADLTRKEIKEGSRILLEKIQKFRPKIAVFNGKLIFEVFSGKKDFNFGRQPECVEGTNTYIWVMPSSSARCAQLPRAADKVPFYFALKKFRDFLNGVISHMDESECVFTEERIREICPQEKSVQNANLNPDSSSPNSANDLQSSGTNFGTTPFPEKKKRGRPKKIKEPPVIDPLTGNIIGNTQQTKAEESNGILNLSVIENIVPGKKKRGRPKKVKPIFEMNPSQNPNISRSGESLAAHSPQTTYHQHGSYEDQASNIKQQQQQQQQQQMYNKISPSLNCTFRITTPPTSNQQTALDNPKSEHINASNVCLSNKNPEEDCSAAGIMQRNNQMSSRIEPQLGESPPPSSPNICTDFEPPSGTASRQVDTDVKRRELNLESQQIQHLQERSRYSSPSQDHMTEQHSDNFQQWMSPQNQSLQQQQQSAAQYSVQHSEHISHLPNHLHYQTENHQVENAQIQNDQWQRNQSFGETSNNYMMTQRHHQIRQEQDQGQGSKASTQLSSDVARKSLSGLESLVDQIPTVSDNEPGCSSGPTAAAIALENRLHDLQCQQNSNQHSSNVSSPNESFAACANRSTGSSITDAPRRSTNSLHNSNFSVSNLAESAVSPNTSSPVFGSNTAINSSGNPYRPNIISAAALAAVSSNPNSSSAHHVPHGPQLYIDPHTHMSHVSSNSMYVPQTHHHSSSHHQHHTLAHHHHPAHHHHAYAASTGSVPSAPDYSIPYGLPTQTSTFHMPSPNYPYGYGSPSAQTNYASYMHSHHAHHAHSAHHLSMFERLKPSDIGSYGGF